MPDHFAKFVEIDTSAGLLIIRQQVSIRRALEELLHVWMESEANDWPEPDACRVIRALNHFLM
jgi:hypothetical protein